MDRSHTHSLSIDSSLLDGGEFSDHDHSFDDLDDDNIECKLVIHVLKTIE